MNEHTSAKFAAGEGHEAPMSELLTREALLMAARLVELVSTLSPGGELVVRECKAALDVCRGVLGARFEESLRASRNRSFGASHGRSPTPLERLVRALSLSVFEVDLLLLAGLPDEHEAFCALLRCLHPRGEPRPSVTLAARLLCRSHQERGFLREALEAGPLARSGALWSNQEPPFVERSLHLGEALWSALHGFDVWPASITRRVEEVPLAGLEQWLASKPVALAVEALGRDDARSVLVNGPDEETAFVRAMAIARAARAPAVALVFDARNRALERLASLHALVRGQVPIVRSEAREGESPRAPLLEHRGPTLVAARAGCAGAFGRRPVLAVDVSRLSASERARAWAFALPELAGQAQDLAARFTLEPAATLEIKADVESLRGLDDVQLGVAEVAASVRARSALALSSNVKLVRASASFSDLVLRESRVVQLREALGRLREQSRVLDEWGFLAGRPGARGVRMLFSGPPGTGKTLSAEVLACALGVDLLVVDISRVVSKWLGETEKNLAEVFDVAERTQAVLLFDEADALFGARTSVSDAHDRYANLETAYLLARLERFEGLCVLATNLRQNVDPAFLRRMEFLVDFEEPDLAERKALWRCHVPAKVPLEADVDLDLLARLYPLVGGFIKNAAVAAAFLAASEHSAIAARHFLRAIYREYEKAGRAFPGLPAGVNPLLI